MAQKKRLVDGHVFDSLLDGKDLQLFRFGTRVIYKNLERIRRAINLTLTATPRPILCATAMGS